MAIITEPGNIDILLDHHVSDPRFAEIAPESEEPGAMQPRSIGAKRLSVEEQRLFFRNSRNFFE